MIAAKLARVTRAVCDTIVVGYSLACFAVNAIRPALLEKEL
jgi:hypothetical protein